jgi:hypothetical protein
MVATITQRLSLGSLETRLAHVSKRVQHPNNSVCENNDNGRRSGLPQVYVTARCRFGWRAHKNTSKLVENGSQYIEWSLTRSICRVKLTMCVFASVVGCSIHTSETISSCLQEGSTENTNTVTVYDFDGGTQPHTGGNSKFLV